MEELSIKIRIADREYPMKVKRTDEERVRTAGRLINEKLKSYREQFGIDDKQDLIAMVAFDCLVDKMAAEETHQVIDQTVFEKVKQLNHLVSQSIL
ncbi:MAG: cell division protein ZapA [Cyclobacteriaceae bacterium]|jgi:cell division protein ZapA|nr:cell division protein ZapA [Bacteroidota bacterium]